MCYDDDFGESVQGVCVASSWEARNPPRKVEVSVVRHRFKCRLGLCRVKHLASFHFGEDESRTPDGAAPHKWTSRLGTLNLARLLRHQKSECVRVKVKFGSRWLGCADTQYVPMNTLLDQLTTETNTSEATRHTFTFRVHFRGGEPQDHTTSATQGTGTDLHGREARPPPPVLAEHKNGTLQQEREEEEEGNSEGGGEEEFYDAEELPVQAVFPVPVFIPVFLPSPVPVPVPIPVPVPVNVPFFSRGYVPSPSPESVQHQFKSEPEVLPVKTCVVGGVMVVLVLGLSVFALVWHSHLPLLRQHHHRHLRLLTDIFNTEPFK